MNIYQAHRILDQTKDNLSYNLDTINRALELTGDLYDRFERSSGKTDRAFSPDGSANGLASIRQAEGKGA